MSKETCARRFCAREEKRVNPPNRLWFPWMTSFFLAWWRLRPLRACSSSLSALSHRSVHPWPDWAWWASSWFRLWSSILRRSAMQQNSRGNNAAKIDGGAIPNPATFGVPYAACRLPSIDCQGQRSGTELLQPAFGMLSGGCLREQSSKTILSIESNPRIVKSGDISSLLRRSFVQICYSFSLSSLRQREKQPQSPS